MSGEPIRPLTKPMALRKRLTWLNAAAARRPPKLRQLPLRRLLHPPQHPPPLLQRQRLQLLQPDPFPLRPQPPGQLPIQEIQSGRTNFQPKRRQSTAAPRVPLCG